VFQNQRSVRIPSDDRIVGFGKFDAIDEAHEGLASLRVLQFLNCFAFDLANPFSGDLEDLANFLEGVSVSVGEAVAKLEDFPFAVVQGLHRLMDLFSQRRLVSLIERIVVAVVFEEFPEEAIVVFTDRLVEGERLFRHFDNDSGIVHGESRALRGFFDGRFTAEFLDQVTDDLSHFAHRVDHVDRDSDSAALISDCSRDSLSDPPSSVGREFEASFVFEFIDRSHQASVTFLDQVEEAQATVAVFFGDGDDKAQVTGGEVSFCRVVFRAEAADFFDATRQSRGGLVSDLHQVSKFLFHFRKGGSFDESSFLRGSDA